MLPLGCLPLWGREGVTIIVTVKVYAKRQDEDFNRA
jgi:hypothetical protein